MAKYRKKPVPPGPEFEAYRYDSELLKNKRLAAKLGVCFCSDGDEAKRGHRHVGNHPAQLLTDGSYFVSREGVLGDVYSAMVFEGLYEAVP